MWDMSPFFCFFGLITKLLYFVGLSWLSVHLFQITLNEGGGVTVPSFFRCQYSNSLILCHFFSIYKLVFASRRASSVLAYSWTKKSACHSNRLVTFRSPLVVGEPLDIPPLPVLRKSNCSPSGVCGAELVLRGISFIPSNGNRDRDYCETSVHPDTRKASFWENKEEDYGCYSSEWLHPFQSLFKVVENIIP